MDVIRTAMRMMAAAKRPVFYTGGGIINSGPEASRLLRELVKLTGFPITSTLMGLGAYPASDPQWLGLIGMHGTYESNLSANRCDLLIALGSRFDDRVTGRVDAFSPASKKIHLDIDAAQINKNIRVDLPIIADAARALRAMIKVWKEENLSADPALTAWWKQIADWRAKNFPSFKNSYKLIKTQNYIHPPYSLTPRPELYLPTPISHTH